MDAPASQQSRGHLGWVVVALGIAVAVAGTLWNLAPLFAPDRQRPRGDGRNAASYGFDLSNALVPQAAIVSSGLVVDGMPALSDPAVITAPEVDRKYLVSSDKVVGLHIGNEARAYPLRLLVWHEAVNDVVGGVPVVVTYHPISEGLVVFDRRIGAETLSFGVSGLLFQSNLLLYDRTGPPHNLAATVWSQLQGRAIAGPRAGASLTLVPFALCRWADWAAAHPETTVVAPIAGEACKYGRVGYGHAAKA